MRFREKIGFVLLLLTFNLVGNSQNKSNNLALTIDVAGNSGFYSLNGEYLICNIKDYKLNARVGVGYSPLDRGDFIGVPIGLSLITGTKKHHLELGLGASYIKGLDKSYFPDFDYGYQMFPKWSEAIYFVPSIGYRYDKLTGGLILKVYYSPLIKVYDFFDFEKLFPLPPAYTSDAYGSSYYQSTNFTDAEKDPRYVYPTAKNKFGYFGVSIGYRFH